MTLSDTFSFRDLMTRHPRPSDTPAKVTIPLERASRVLNTHLVNLIRKDRNGTLSDATTWLSHWVRLENHRTPSPALRRYLQILIDQDPVAVIRNTGSDKMRKVALVEIEMPNGDKIRAKSIDPFPPTKTLDVWFENKGCPA